MKHILTKSIADIAKLVKAGSGVEFQGIDVRSWHTSCVYMYLKDGAATYVGSSKNGMMRVLCPYHKQAKESRLECDKLIVWFCESVADARQSERLLIVCVKPKHNERLKSFTDKQILGVSNIFS
jgi:hypothetical protein